MQFYETKPILMIVKVCTFIAFIANLQATTCFCTGSNVCQPPVKCYEILFLSDEQLEYLRPYAYDFDRLDLLKQVYDKFGIELFDEHLILSVFTAEYYTEDDLRGKINEKINELVKNEAITFLEKLNELQPIYIDTQELEPTQKHRQLAMVCKKAKSLAVLDSLN